MNLNPLIVKCVQPKRRLHIKTTATEMFFVSYILYGGVSVIGLLALLLPTWSALDKTSLFFVSILGFVLALIFYVYRAIAPLWIAIAHIPVGIALVNMSVYLGHGVQSVGFGLIFVLSSAYLFHYITKLIAIFAVLCASILYAFTLQYLNIDGWQSIVLFSMGNCYLMGLIIWHMTRRMHRLSTQDSLTGLINRQTIDAIMFNLIDSFKTKKQNFTLFIIDLNNFKLVNDTKGHLEGDKVLIQFSRQLKMCVQDSDHVARWGGDEFVVILLDASKQKIKHFEDTLRSASKETIGFELGFSQPKLNDTLDTLMQRADKKMYHRKLHRRSTD